MDVILTGASLKLRKLRREKRWQISCGLTTILRESSRPAHVTHLLNRLKVHVTALGFVWFCCGRADASRTDDPAEDAASPEQAEKDSLDGFTHEEISALQL